MFKVTAVANGYYGGKIRVPGEVFGIAEPEDFSIAWMDTDEAKVLANVRERSKEKPGEDEEKDVAAGIRARSDRYKRWLDAKAKADGDDDDAETRRVNTGGTDGVVGVEVPKAGAKLTAAQKKALAKAATGTEPKSAAAAEQTLDNLAGAGGSDNDDRSRDAAIDQSKNANDWEQPTPVEE